MSMPATPRLIALHLPQYYPIPENDAAWGRGFTEWTHVATARSLYPGHGQPRIPGELGFYDMRLAETRTAQADLAAKHGIEAFCYWHYWFAGRRVLEKPVEAILQSGEPHFSFCLSWANASWTGAWYGKPNQTLIEQTYPGEDDHRAHFEAVLPMLRDPRYMRVDDLPLFGVFQPSEIPDVERFCELWRKLARSAGLPGLHLVGFGTVTFEPERHGFDASVQHAPRLPWPLRGKRAGWQRFLGIPAILSYKRFVKRGLPRVASELDYPVVIPNWDNTPRSGRRGSVLHGSTPELFRWHLREAIERASERPPEHQIVFIKSWNEWAEGNYLEPDLRHGRAYLEVVRDEVKRAARAGADSIGAAVR
jgi:lipopolysaccharide biosynthesis protein